MESESGGNILNSKPLHFVVGILVIFFMMWWLVSDTQHPAIYP